jgi:hypothetical protein
MELFGIEPDLGHGLLIHELSISHETRNKMCRFTLDGRYLIGISNRQITSLNRQTFMLPAGFEHIISAGQRPHYYGLDRESAGNEYFATLLD